MHRLVRTGLTLAALFLGLILAGCEDFDPTAVFDSEFFNTKKKLPGERHPVFPEGTPGVPQGVPPELVRGYQPPPEPAPETTQATAAPSETKEKPKAKPRPRMVAKPAEPPTQAPVQSAPPQAQSAEPSSPQAAPATGAWSQRSGGIAWPDPPPR